MSLLAVVIATGCRPPPDAPDKIEEMMTYGFSHFDHEDPAYMEALAANMVAWAEEHIEETREGLTVNSLSAADLQAAGVADPDTDSILGTAIGYDYHATPADVAWGLSLPDLTVVYSNYIEFEATYDGDRACFVDQDCDELDWVIDLHSSMPMGLEYWDEFDAQMRWVELDDGSLLLAHRTLGDDPLEFNKDWLQIVQQYSFSATFEQDGMARRLWAIWVDGRILDDELPETFALNMGVSSMLSNVEELDAYLQEQRGR